MSSRRIAAAKGPSVVPPAKRHIGQILISQGILTEDQLRIALLEQLKTNQPVGRLLVQLGFVSEATLRDALSEKLGLQSVDLSQIIVDAAALKLVSREFAKRHALFPVALDREKRSLIIAIADTHNVVALDQLRAQLRGQYEIDVRLSGETEIARAIDQYYGHDFSIDGILHEIETGELDYDSLQASGDAYSQPVVRLISALLADAVERSASDIHFEPEQNFLRIRYRIDGVLRQIRSLHKTYWPAMAVRIKVMAKMNIAETRAPQDGRFSLELAGRPVDFRVASQITTHGENVVLRILDRQKGILPLDRLGLAEDRLALLARIMARPEGLILVTGPTGSGKTTTLYSILHHLNSEGVNIMTLEDPVEHPLAQLRQTSINEAAKLDFASGIRSILRQDPDVILVGEIRDEETARMALRAAMTGHQVYATLHSNSAVGAIPRLADSGIAAGLLSGNLIGIIAQRLVRRVCAQCRELRPATAVELRLLGVPVEAPPLVAHAVGCAHCDGRGYRGRLAIMEILRIDDELDELIARGATARELQRCALAQGMRMLVDDGVRRVIDGSTTLDELARVVDLSGRM